MERALLRLGHNLTVTPVRKANIIQIDYSSRDPHQAGQVLRQLADSYLDEHLRIFTEHRERMNFLPARNSAIEKELQDRRRQS